MSRFFHPRSAVLLSLLCTSPFAMAQSITGVLVGTVTDASGAMVPGAQVTIRDTATNRVLVLKTNSDGEYKAANLNPSVYEITVEASGFSKFTVSGARLLVSSTSRNDVKLTVGAADRTVEVKAAPDAISTDTSSLGDVVESSAIARLPLNGRTIDRILTFVAGNTSDNATNPKIGGSTHWSGSYYTVDGVPFNDLGNGAAAYSYNTNLTTLPSTEVVSEVKIESSLAKAEYEGGAAISMLTKSGSNQFHGTLYEFNRNRAYAARDYYTRVGVTPKPGLNRNEFGGVLGGPIWRDRTFFFGSAEYLLQRQGKPYTFSVPTDAQRAGDFSGLPTITDPYTGLPFTNNKIPNIDSRAAALLAFVPHANQAGTGAAGTGNNLVQSVPTQYDVFRYFLKFDHKLNNVHALTISGGYSYGDPYFAPNGTPATYGNYASAGYKTYSALARDYMVINSRMVNEVHYAYMSHRSIRRGQNTSFDPSTLFPGLYGPFAIGGLPTVSITGYTGIGDTGGTGYSPETIQQVLDNFTLVRGHHTIKVGAAVDFDSIAIKSGTSSSVLGTFGFTGRYTANAANTAGNALADFLLGYANSSSRATPQVPIYNKFQRYAFFGQDDWNITSNLVLNVGLRWEMQSTPTDARGDFTNFDFNSGKMVLRTVGGKLPLDANATVMALYPNTYTTSEAVGWGSSVLTTDKKDFGPRLGFAWRPFHNEAMVVRGGYGIYYNFVPPYIGIRQISQLNFPFVLNQTYTATSSTTPSLTLANPFPGTGTVAANPSIYAVNRDLKNARVQQWNATVEQLLPGNVGFRLSYLGNKATQVPFYLYNKNLPNPQRALTTLQSGRPYQPWGDILTLVSKGAAFTNQGQVEVTKRTGNGLYLQTSYTWNSSIDNVPIAASPQDPYNPAGDRGTSESTRRHNFFISGTYALPFHRAGFGARAVNGWSIATLSQVRSGLPFTPTISIPGTTSLGGSSVGWYASRPNVVQGVNPYPAVKTKAQWFNSAAFALPAPFTFGNARRNSLTGPNEVTMDLSVEKSTVITEGSKLLLRFDAFNALNHPNFGTPASNISVTSTSGVISSTNSNAPARQVQIGAKLVF